MTTATAFGPETVDDRRVSRTPWPVVTAFYLWWALILAQSLGLAYIGFTLGLAARIGGPAWDILFVDVPIGLPTLVLVALEVVFVLRLRRGSRAARIWLAVLALPAAASVVVILNPIVSASLIASNSVEFTNAPIGQAYQQAYVAIIVAASALALAAAILPFTRPAKHFFRKVATAASRDRDAPVPADLSAAPESDTGSQAPD